MRTDSAEVKKLQDQLCYQGAAPKRTLEPDGLRGTPEESRPEGHTAVPTAQSNEIRKTF